MITRWQQPRMLIIIVSGGDAYSIIRDKELSLTSSEIAKINSPQYLARGVVHNVGRSDATYLFHQLQLTSVTLT